jgi:predicted ATPase
MLEAFRNEIVEAEKGRMDLLKWKLLLIAGLGTVGFGLSSSGKSTSSVLSPHLLLCLIPLVCIYVDSLCQHLQMRILVISEFFRNYKYQGRDIDMMRFRAYEKFCHDARLVFLLEDLAQHILTIFFSLLILVIAFTFESVQADRTTFLISGSLGIVLTISLLFLRHFKVKHIEEHGRNLK